MYLGPGGRARGAVRQGLRLVVRGRDHVRGCMISCYIMLCHSLVTSIIAANN